MTVNSSGGNLVQTIAADGTAIITCVLLTGTSAASWNSSYILSGGGIGGSTGATDNAVLRADGVGGSTLQASPVSIADTTGVISGTQGVTLTGSASGTTAVVATAAASGTITLPAATDTLVGKATTDTLTNKTIDADGTGNSITNIENADIKAAAAIAVNKLAALTASEAVVTDGSGFLTTATGVSATEVGYLNGVTSAIQTQMDAKQATITFGTGVQTALGVNVGSAGAPVLFNGAGGTPSSITLTNASGTAASLTAGTASAVAVGGITGLGSNVATWLATPSSANLISAVTDETGSGALVFGTTPTIGTPIITSPQMSLTAAHGSDDTYTGTTIVGLNAGATIAQWEAVYLGGASTWLLADANGASTYPARGLAVAAYSSTNPATILVNGTVRNDAWNWTPGGTIYLSGTPGALTQSAPAVSGDKVQQIGFALTADIAFFDFNTTYTTIA